MISNKESKPIFQNYLEMELQNDDNWPDSLISAVGGYGHAQGPPPPLEAPRGSERSECWDSVGTGCSRRNSRPRVLTEEGKSRAGVLGHEKKGGPDTARATASTGSPAAPAPQGERAGCAGQATKVRASPQDWGLSPGHVGPAKVTPGAHLCGHTRVVSRAEFQEGLRQLWRERGTQEREAVPAVQGCLQECVREGAESAPGSRWRDAEDKTAQEVFWGRRKRHCRPLWPAEKQKQPEKLMEQTSEVRKEYILDHQQNEKATSWSEVKQASGSISMNKELPRQC